MKKFILLVMGLVGFSIIKIHVEATEELASTTKFYKTITPCSLVALEDNLSLTTEVSADEYYSASVNTKDGFVESVYKRMTVKIVQDSNTYKYIIELFWKNIPKVRSYDVISLSHMESVKLNSLGQFAQKYCYKEGKCYTATGYPYYQKTSTSYAVVFMVANGELSSLSQTLILSVVKNTTATVVRQKLIGDYAHATKKISLENAKKFIIDYRDGIIHDSSVRSYYDTIAVASTEWQGSW